jgi:probable F420-dependent oxidoreductase
MDYGLTLPNYRAGSSPEGIEAAAEIAERLDWSTVWTTDHVLVPHSAEDDYGRVFDAILTLAWLATAHPTLKLGTSVIVVPYRNSVVVAKQLATLDALSGGRVIAGVGVGWNTAEFRNLGAADRFRVRGALLDETIALWRHLWSGSSEPFEGRFHPLEDFVFEPLPAQGAALPIYVGGRAEAALRRVGRVADAYHSSATSPTAYAERLPVIRAAAEEAGRPMPKLTARGVVRFDRVDASSWAIQGTPEQMAAEIDAFAALGVEHLAVGFDTTDPGEVVARAERFAREVLPLVGAGG